MTTTPSTVASPPLLLLVPGNFVTASFYSFPRRRGGLYLYFAQLVQVTCLHILHLRPPRSFLPGHVVLPPPPPFPFHQTSSDDPCLSYRPFHGCRGTTCHDVRLPTDGAHLIHSLSTHSPISNVVT
ncbi:hypothetical protein PISMIDRAFT_186659 [Pisolithus microcarpus 441]|uniref:Uncharacterized protein n=1 Tax=Pisolithus microcarpus 441 TaxID=765257 RepID=A0A0D0A626_9AGAM|nr:hypothetical protein BKA83DRAFT_186659 [Pisolithus microcarpus]KIK27488.1 hypothetical protein PISMIDRAFT_186659 [Pisolithus microcarpus 441]